MSPCDTCEEHSSLMESFGSIKGQLSILLKLVVILVAGMGYAITQNHTADLQLATATMDIASTKEMLIQSKSLHEIKLASLENEFGAISTLCCGEIDGI